ncbi:MAG: hypothetical protein MUO88_06300, partial [Desulfobacterales bacterium]|nr:hypothetical protein [Desulfobacterales bacterium]
NHSKHFSLNCTIAVTGKQSSIPQIDFNSNLLNDEKNIYKNILVFDTILPNCVMHLLEINTG